MKNLFSKLLRGASSRPLLSSEKASLQAWVVVQCFYALNIFWSVKTAKVMLSTVGQTADLLWPVVWIDWLQSQLQREHLVGGLTVITIGSSLLVAWFPKKRWARIFAAVCILQASAYLNSFGKINHGSHSWLWVGIVFIFLPNSENRKPKHHALKTLQTFWSAQCLVLFFYSMAGLLKLAPVPLQWLRGEEHTLSPTAMARHIAYRAMQTGEDAWLGSFFVNHIWLSYPLFLAGVYLELASIVVAFRPNLHRFWGLSLISLHISVGLTMGIWFNQTMILVGLLFVASPFVTKEQPLREALADIPGWQTIRKLTP